MPARLLQKLAFAGLFFSSIVQAMPLDYEGTLGFVELDTGGTYSGTPLGTPFNISIDDLRADGSFANGSLSGAGLTTSFSCAQPTFIDVDSESRCSPLASGPDVSVNTLLDSYAADLLNTIFAVDAYAAGDLVDIVNVEGDFGTPDDRIEVGFSFLFDGGTFSDDPLFEDLMPQFDPSQANHTLFFIFEEEDGEDLYSAIGAAALVMTTPTPAPNPDSGSGSGSGSGSDQGSGPSTPVPEPASIVLLGLGATLLMRRRNR